MQDKYPYLPRSASYTAEPTLPSVYFLHKKEVGVSLRQIFFGDGRHVIDKSMKRAFVDVKAPFPLLRIQVDVGRYFLCQFQYLTEVFLVSGRHMISLFMK